jgi:hypothetical protein
VQRAVQGLRHLQLAAAAPTGPYDLSAMAVNSYNRNMHLLLQVQHSLQAARQQHNVKLAAWDERIALLRGHLR